MCPSAWHVQSFAPKRQPRQEQQQQQQQQQLSSDVAANKQNAALLWLLLSSPSSLSLPRSLSLSLALFHHTCLPLLSFLKLTLSSSSTLCLSYSLLLFVVVVVLYHPRIVALTHLLSFSLSPALTSCLLPRERERERALQKKKYSQKSINFCTCHMPHASEPKSRRCDVCAAQEREVGWSARRGGGGMTG